MNRLTERTSDGIAYTKIPLNESHLNKRGVIEQCFTGFVADRLAAYEDSGLSPEEVQKMALAQQEGRLVVLPCKAGDIVYADCYGDIIGWEVHQIEMRTGEPTQYIARGDDEGYGAAEIDFTGEDIGKTVFLTREEAEKALQEGLR